MNKEIIIMGYVVPPRTLLILGAILTIILGFWIGTTLSHNNDKAFQDQCSRVAKASSAWSYGAYPERCVLFYGSNVMEYTK